MDPDEETASEIPGGELSIRVRRDGSIEAAYDGEPVPVEKIDIDALSLKRLADRPRLLR